MAFSQSDSALQELLEELQNNLPDLPVSLKDLRNPKPEFMMNFFQVILDELSVEVDTLLKPPGGLDPTDEWLSTSRGVHLLYAMKAVYPQKVGVLQKMTLDTLLDPNPSDILFVKAALNFYTFACYEVLKMSAVPIVKEKEDVLGEMKDRIANAKSMKEALDGVVLDNNCQENRVSEIHEKMCKVKQEISDLKSILQNKSIIKEELLVKEAELCHALNQLKEDNAEKGEQLQRLTTCVVQSPDRLISTKQEIKDSVEEMKKEIDTLCAVHLEIKALVEMLKLKEEQMNGLTEAFKCFLESKETIMHYEMDINNFSETILKQMKVSEYHFECQLKLMKETLAEKKREYRKFWDMAAKRMMDFLRPKIEKQENLKKKLENTQKTKKLLEAEVNDCMETKNAREAVRKELWDEYTEECRSREDKIDSMIAEFEGHLFGKHNKKKKVVKEVQEVIDEELKRLQEKFNELMEGLE